MTSNQEKLKFHRMTKPIKFRRTRLFLMSVGHSYGVGVYKLKYVFNYILYKLHILNRYVNTSRHTIWNPKIQGEVYENYEKNVECRCVGGTIWSFLKDDFSFKSDYFYFMWKKHRHITFVACAEEIHSYILVTSLVDPFIVIGARRYSLGQVPRIFTSYHKKLGSSEKGVPPVPVATTYDFSKLLNVSNKVTVGCNEDSLNSEILKQINNVQVEGLKEYLNTITLHDLEV